MTHEINTNMLPAKYSDFTVQLTTDITNLIEPEKIFLQALFLILML